MLLHKWIYYQHSTLEITIAEYFKSSLNAPGKTITQKLFINPRPRISKYVGIIPPLNNIVNAKQSIKYLFPGKSFLDIEYAAKYCNDNIY